MKSVDYIELNALAIIYSCTIGQVHLLVYYIKTKSRLSVCLSVGTFWHARSSAVSPRTYARFARNEAPVLGEYAVLFKMFVIHVVRRRRRFECQGVDDSCRNFTYIPAKPQPRHNRSYILHFCFNLLSASVAEWCMCLPLHLGVPSLIPSVVLFF